MQENQQMAGDHQQKELEAARVWSMCTGSWKKVFTECPAV